QAPMPPGYGQQPQAPMPPGYGQQPPGGQFPGQPAAPQGAAPQGAGVAAALQKYREAPTGQRWTQQNEKLVRVDLSVAEQPILARQGSMVLYQGKVEFSYKGAGFAGRIVGNATGQEMQLMRCSGRGQVFLAEEATHLHPIELQGDAICVSAENVLAFDESLQHEVRRIEGHGIPGGALFVMQFQGTGTVVVKTHGVPVVLPVTPTTFADCHAVVAWSAAAQAIVSSQVRLRSNAYAGSTGESVNLQFRGAPGNFIVVQPYEV
uniref:AIM24 family protein n=1 Tax=Streptomyces atriruber TaxID=545121 RepID=UPI000A85A9B2